MKPQRTGDGGHRYTAMTYLQALSIPDCEKGVPISRQTLTNARPPFTAITYTDPVRRCFNISTKGELTRCGS
ncbi:hypothetical protein KCP76_23780 [Salmonella enterica subsp. enterica serovar Weltevreden]|nr:hypothetical protein KCP76_23780 [Salmonella enterica subsp. enterica serovar Weltevreden]